MVVFCLLSSSFSWLQLRSSKLVCFCGLSGGFKKEKLSFIHPGGFAFLFQLFVQQLRQLRSKLFSENPELPLRLDLEGRGGERWEERLP